MYADRWLLMLDDLFWMSAYLKDTARSSNTPKMTLYSREFHSVFGVFLWRLDDALLLNDTFYIACVS